MYLEEFKGKTSGPGRYYRVCGRRPQLRGNNKEASLQYKKCSEWGIEFNEESNVGAVS